MSDFGGDMKTKIIYDSQAFTMQKTGGISRYFASVIQELDKINEVSPLINIPFANNHYLSDIQSKPFTKLFHTYRGRGCSAIMGIGNYANSLSVKAMARQHRNAVLHPTYYNCNLIDQLKTFRKVITVHDMIHELFPDNVADPETVNNKKRMMKAADAIITISESTKRDILNLYPNFENKIKVIYHGSSFGNEVIKTPRIIPQAYILFVGTRGGYKNFEALAKAFAQLSITDLQLVCAGGGQFSPSELNKFRELGIESRVSQISPTDDTLANLYTHAELFVFPSRYEGFGLPTLEAMACGAPCILSDASSLPEVGGNAALYFQPDSVEQLAEQCTKILESSSLQEDLRKKGLEQSQLFTWEKCAQQHADIYLSL